MAKRRRYSKRTDSRGRLYVVDTSTGKRAKLSSYERETKRRAKEAEQARRAAERHERALRAAETRRQRAKVKKPKKPRETILRNKKALLAAKQQARSEAAKKGWETRRERQYIKEERAAIEAAFPIPEGVTLVELWAPPTVQPEYRVNKREARQALRAHAEQSDKDAYDRFKQYKRQLYTQTLAKLQTRVPQEVLREAVARAVAPELYQLAVDEGFDELTAARFARLS